MSGDNVGGSQVVLVTGGFDHTVKLWQAHSGVCLRTMQHPDSCLERFGLCFWDVHYGHGMVLVIVNKGPDSKLSKQVNGLEITPNGQMVAAYGHQHIRMYDLCSGNPEPVLSFEGLSKNVTKLGFQEDGKWMYTGGEDCTARIWDLRAGRQFQCQRIFQVSVPVNAAMLHPDQSQIMVGDQSGNIHIWDLRTDQHEQLAPEAEASIQDIAIDTEGKLMAAINNKGNCYVWNLSGELPRPIPKKHIKAHSKYGLRCKFSPDSSMLATTSADWSAKVWHTHDWSLKRELKCESQRWVWDAAFSIDSRYLFTGSSDSYARLWDLEKGSLEREYCGHQKPITALAFRDQKAP